jgi:hypothetical protein
VTGHEIDNTANAGAAVVTDQDRQAAVSSWLLGATEDSDAARKQWQEQDRALLACGGILSAIKAPAHLVWAAARSEDLREVDAYLASYLDGSGVVLELHTHLYYFLVPGSTTWEWGTREYPGVEYLGWEPSRRNFLGVPALHVTEPVGRSYWSVPLEAPGDLLYADQVAQLLRDGRAVRAGGGIR